jgi:predicted signal transduction protein with EAL and GGDEF domain
MCVSRMKVCDPPGRSGPESVSERMRRTRNCAPSHSVRRSERSTRNITRHVAKHLEGSIRPSDTVGRLGGDEFAVVLPGLQDATEAHRIAQRGLDAIEQPLPLDDGVVLKLKASVGIALHPTHADDPGHLLRRADVAMYRIKRLGGGIAFYDPQRDREQLECLSFVAELQHAIDVDQLVLCYQPKIDLRTGRTVGVECLVRWQHAIRGLIAPIQFIPLAESTGLIKPLSVWVIRKALQQWRSWYERGLEIPVAVNLSTPLLYDPDLPVTIDREMRA